MGWDDIDARWQQLNPVFVRGMQRSGTSIMGRALRRMNIAGFGEGHLWFDLVEPFTQLRDPAYHPHLREDEYALGQGRVAQLEKYIAVALDQFHRDHLSSDLKRWMDKSPGAEAVRIAPLLAELFPRSQFIFMYRNGITNVHSGIKFWADYPGIFQVMCQGWTETMSAWREVRKSLRGRYIEIAQEIVCSIPGGGYWSGDDWYISDQIPFKARLYFNDDDSLNKEKTWGSMMDAFDEAVKHWDEEAIAANNALNEAAGWGHDGGDNEEGGE